MNEEQGLDAADIPAIHNALAKGFTDRYIAKMKLSALAYGEQYDPDSPLSDYETTWWPAAPKAFSNQLAYRVLGGIFRMRPRRMEQVFYSRIEERAESIERSLAEYPLMAVNGHSPDLQAAIPLYGISRVMAARQPGNFRANLHDMYRDSHVVATRGLVPLKVGRRNHPFQTDNLTLLRAARLITNPHFSFPRTPVMQNSGIPEEFFKRYNAKFRQDCLDVVSHSGDHPLGQHQVWSMAPGAGPDLKGKGVQAGLQITQAVGGATIKLVRSMGVGLLPVYASFSKASGGPSMELGGIIPPDEVTDLTLPGIMQDFAVYRRAHGEPNVYYAEEDLP